MRTSIYYVRRKARYAVKAMAKLPVLLVLCVVHNKNVFVVVNALICVKVSKLEVEICILGTLISLNFYFYFPVTVSNNNIMKSFLKT